MQSDVMINNIIITTTVIVINIITVRPRCARAHYILLLRLRLTRHHHYYIDGGGDGVALSCNLGFASANHHRCLYSYYPLTSLRSVTYDGGGGTINLAPLGLFIII